MADLEASLPLIWGRTVHSVFIGGGTPSLFSPESIDQLISGLRARLRMEPDCEITMEANPGTFEKDRFRAFRHAGISRLSIGVQSFDDRFLRPSAVCTAATRRARRWRRRRVPSRPSTSTSCMRCPARPSDLVRWKRRCPSPPHISIYHLTIEPNTYFAKYPPQVPEDDAAYDMLDRITAMTGQRACSATKSRPMRATATSVSTTPTTGSSATTWALARARTASSALPTASCAR
jgi:oxygen-independent coproporphyrinogen-3 oxidase